MWIFTYIVCRILLFFLYFSSQFFDSLKIRLGLRVEGLIWFSSHSPPPAKWIVGKGVLSGDVRGKEGRAFGKWRPLELGGSLGRSICGRLAREAGWASPGGTPRLCTWGSRATLALCRLVLIGENQRHEDWKWVLAISSFKEGLIVPERIDGGRGWGGERPVLDFRKREAGRRN